MKQLHRADSESRRHYVANRNSDENINAKLLYAGELKSSRDFAEQNHTHAFCEIVFIKSGSGFLNYDGKRYPVNKGDLLVYNPSVPHSESSVKGKELSAYFCGIDSLKLKNMPINHILKSGRPPVVHTKEWEKEFEQYFFGLIREVQTKDFYCDVISRSLVKNIIGLVLRLLARSDADYFRTNESFISAKKFIDEHYQNIECVEDICKHMYISRFYLTHLFKEYSGVSPIRYIITKRMEKAKELLSDTHLSITEIANLTGYTEAGSFIKTFKKILGVTPGEYRAKNSCRIEKNHSPTRI